MCASGNVCKSVKYTDKVSLECVQVVSLQVELNWLSKADGMLQEWSEGWMQKNKKKPFSPSQFVQSAADHSGHSGWVGTPLVLAQSLHSDFAWSWPPPLWWSEDIGHKSIQQVGSGMAHTPKSLRLKRRDRRRGRGRGRKGKGLKANVTQHGMLWELKVWGQVWGGKGRVSNLHQRLVTRSTDVDWEEQRLGPHCHAGGFCCYPWLKDFHLWSGYRV